MTTLSLPRKLEETPLELRFVERKTRANQRPRLILQELITETVNDVTCLRWRDVPIEREP
jgi:hypothetical protein